jgi:hypothetical protein
MASTSFRASHREAAIGDSSACHFDYRESSMAPLEPKYQNSSYCIFELISRAEDDGQNSGGRMGMARRRETASGSGLPPEQGARFERIVIQLLEITPRCKDPEIQYELMRLADQLVELAEG